MHWVSTSPWLASPSPASQSGAPNAPTCVPGRARTRFWPASMLVIPANFEMSITVPEVTCTGENECRAPTTRMFWRSAIAWLTAASTPASSPGESNRETSQRWFPTQLTNVCGTGA